MDDLERAVLARLPLAEAVLRVWAYIAGDEVLQEAFAAGRGRTYEGVLTFPGMVRLFADAISAHGGSGRRSMLRAAEHRRLPVSLPAAYGKLRRVPVAVSEEMLRRCTARLMDLLPPDPGAGLPPSLAGFNGLVLDAQTIKGLDRRLKATRGVRGGLLGGRTLAALSLRTGLIVETTACEDGYANEASLLPAALPRVRGAVPGPRLWVADRQFCFLAHLEGFTAEAGDAFIVRHRADARFTPDPACPVREGTEARGRVWTEVRGTLRAHHPERQREVRLITLRRPGKQTVRVVTSLLDGDRYPAADVLEVYLARWGIERVFQQITEVFGLQRLIGSSPGAAIFQFTLCALWYNVIQAFKRFVAPGGPTTAAAVSGENLFDDVKRHLIACDVLAPLASVAAALPPDPTPAALRDRLDVLLRPLWTPRWIRSPPKNPDRHRPHSGGTRNHASAYRVIQKHKQRENRKRQ